MVSKAYLICCGADSRRTEAISRRHCHTALYPGQGTGRAVDKSAEGIRQLATAELATEELQNFTRLHLIDGLNDRSDVSLHDWPVVCG